MTLLELCEPLFQYVCRLNRSARKAAAAGRTAAGDQDAGRVRAEVIGILQDLRSRSSAEPRLIDQFERIELALLFFVDFMIKESQLPFARDWRELAFDRKELAGDEKFFDLLEETLADPGESATERLAVFYTCIGLGFTGIYTGQAEYLRRKMLQLSSRLRAYMQTDDMARICEDSYRTDTRNLIEPPGKKLVGIAIALAGLILVLFLANFYLFRWTLQDLTRMLDELLARVR